MRDLGGGSSYGKGRAVDLPVTPLIPGSLGIEPTIPDYDQSCSNPGQVKDTGQQLAASNISYDSTVTGIDCAHVQCAIDSLWAEWQGTVIPRGQVSMFWQPTQPDSGDVQIGDMWYDTDNPGLGISTYIDNTPTASLVSNTDKFVVSNDRTMNQETREYVYKLLAAKVGKRIKGWIYFQGSKPSMNEGDAWINNNGEVEVCR